MAVCDCNLGLSNTGTPSCQPLAGVTKKLIIVPITADDGTLNRIDIANDTLDETFFDGKYNNADTSKRWYPTPLIDNIEDTRADALTETLNSGQNLKVQDGARAFNGVMVNQEGVFLGKLETAGCTDVGVYHIDKEGNLVGSLSSDGLFLEPIAVDKGTWNVILVKTTDTTVPKVQLTFEYLSTEKDADLRLYSASDISGFDTLNSEGLLDVNGTEFGVATTTGFVVDLKLDYGPVASLIAVEGWVAADFSLFNETDVLTVVITSVTESATVDGRYTFVIPAQTSADVLTLTDVKDGFELAAVTITIP